jgi:hypothetical protein
VATTRRVQRVVQEHVRGRDLIDDAEVAGLASDLDEPSADDGPVAFGGHEIFSPAQIGWVGRGSTCCFPLFAE